MPVSSKLCIRASLAALVVVSLCALPLSARALESKSPKPRARVKVPLQIAVQDSNATQVAGPSPHPAKTAALSFNRDYQAGDQIVIAGPQRIAVQLDEHMPECQLFLSDSAAGKFVYEVPLGRAEQQTGSAYSPDSFAGKSHRVTARALGPNEVSSYRNLALNPCDLLQPQDGPALAYPHSTTNSYSRNLYDFAARNAIDGISQNGHHGVWPYQSWGPGLRLDLWWNLDFGRPVEIDKIRLMVRADFPHDSYWKSAVVEFSDGSRLPIQINSSADFQEFAFPSRKVSWFRITNLVPEDPARWCSLIEVEAWGRDLP